MSTGPDDRAVFVIEPGTVPPLSALRRWTGRVLPLLGADHLWAVRLVVTELATNAHEHGAGPVTITASADPVPCSVLLEVHDDGPERPVTGEPGAGTPHGRGLVLVRGLSRAWGVRGTGLGKTVWARIDCGSASIGRCPVRPEPIAMDPEPC
ncbi:ATP-binding protein [Amycolatopsis eburnea]|uniref:ATP-binding protein n=1 Tax=Amycolatopsis eburnea TaxID=2267691 RepID=A0A427T6Q7_9PSEU|nr:ATP-binding protein [Amycolatopsis eburnea]RSD15396.1 ATP-binding protein [Amycolatopsis eburnea]